MHDGKGLYTWHMGKHGGRYKTYFIKVKPVRLALLFAGGVILVYLMYEIKMLFVVVVLVLAFQI